MKRRTPQAFTTVEILVVMGILLLLAGMLFVGMRYVGRSGNVSATRTTLANARALIAEFEATASRERFNRGVDAIYGGSGPILAPGLVTEGSPDRTSEDGAVHETHELMAILHQAPNNRTAIEQVPPNRLLRDPNDPDHPPVLLDAWNNPIIFVPAGGLCGHDNANDPRSMWIGGARNSPGARQVVANPSGNQVGPIQSPDRRPFFASAGPSGDFRNGDDNIYSFED